MKKSDYIICGGRTGGPLLPLISLHTQLEIPKEKVVIVGINNGFERSYAQTHEYSFISVPEAKLSLASFSKQEGVIDSIVLIGNNIRYLFNFIFSYLKSIHILIKHKPKVLFNAGSFVGVPLIWAAFMLKKLHLINTKIYIHQQDPLIGLANKLTLPCADVASYVFEYSCSKNTYLQSAFKVCNFVDINKLTPPYECNNHDFQTLISTSQKPLLFVYGGGSGSFVLNEWVVNNLDLLLKKYNIIHLLGSLQKPEDIKRWQNKQTKRYKNAVSTYTDIPYILSHASWVVSRAGLGSISELEFMQKNTILVPLKHSHQEINAKLSDHFAHIVDEGELDRINTIIENIERTSSIHIADMAESYFSSQKNFFDYMKNIL